MMEPTPGYYRHFKDAVAPITRGNSVSASGKGHTILGMEKRPALLDRESEANKEWSFRRDSRSFRSYGRTLRVLAGKAASKVIRADKLNELS